MSDRSALRSTLRQSHSYRPDIDGLRAFAVLPVVFFHAAVPGFSGGFVGVDVFYVISGYLITSIIAREVDLNRFSIVTFYERRVRRIFPALFFVVLIALLAALILLAPADLLGFGKSLLAMTLFSSNMYFERHGGTDGYFGNDSDSQPLLHTWSLSVEEQFYLFFPAVLILLTKYSGRRRVLFLSALAIASFTVSLWQMQHQPLSAFYLLIPRAWELLIGSLLALKAVSAVHSPATRNLIGAIGLALLGYAIVAFDKETLFPGVSALVPCLGAAMIIFAGETGPHLIGRILSLGPLVFVGVVSYSLYLWHWPILVFARYFRAGPLATSDVVVAICASVLLAFISYKFVESPFRGSTSRVVRRQVFRLGFVGFAILGLAGVALFASRGLPQRFSDSVQQQIARNTERRSDYQEVCSNWKKPIASVADINYCILGSQLPKRIMFWGDSHVQQLYPLIARLFTENELDGHGVLFAIDQGCMPAEHLNRPDPGFHCDSFTHYAMMRAEQPDVDVVFIGFAAPPVTLLCPSVNGRCVDSMTPAQADTHFLQELASRIRRLRSLGKHVVVSLPFPLYDRPIPELQVRNAILERWGSVAVPTDRTLTSARNRLASVATESGAVLFDPRVSLCGTAGCLTQVAGLSIYKDHSHLAASQIGILAGEMTTTLRQAMSDPGAAGE